MLALGFVSLVRELTARKGAPVQMLVARLALQLHLAFSTSVRSTSERKNMLLCFALLADVASAATRVLIPDCISFVL